ncbi:DUF6193 family natural product biosynthesis protein [Dactylosporangium sp. CA-139066]|uniref:DUF6193 family natural product biosynthesis protein n=1 Tax=Dactylosporangium sp. CA-139066 TaxID=3239930 RepID=UPI003D8C94A3
MPDSSGPAGPDPSHYPDVAAAGDLRAALQHEFDVAGVALRALHVSSPGRLRIGAEVRAADRRADVLLAPNRRIFLVSFWMRDVRMALGKAGELDDAAAAVATFLSGAGVRQLRAAWPFVRYGGFAEAFERGEAEEFELRRESEDAIAYRWRQYLDLTPASHTFELHDFFVAAAVEPRLRALFPFTSHCHLGFRRSASDPASRALAWVRPFGAGQYLIAGPDLRQLYPADVRRTMWEGESIPEALGPAGVQDSVALVLTVLDREHHT